MKNDTERIVLEYIKRLNSLTVLRDMLNDDVFKSLLSAFAAIANGDPITAEKASHKFVHKLITENPRRVSGNLFADHIIAGIVEKENRFSADAASGISDPLIFSLMMSDIDALLDAAKLSASDLQGYIRGIHTSSNDRISALSSAVWGGNSIDTDSVGSHDVLSHLEYHVRDWVYDDADMNRVYPCENDLSELYDVILSSDASEITDALWHFFNTVGTGIFIKNRLFASDESHTFMPISEPLPEQNLLPFMYHEEHDRLAELAVAFANGENVSNTVLLGASGSGKTTMLNSLTEVESDLRFIFVSGYSLPDFTEIFEMMRKQPLRFAIILDDLQACGDISRFFGHLMKPENVVFFAATSDEAQAEAFDSVIKLVPPDIAGLTKYICDISFSDESAESVKNACMDYQIETKKPLSYGAVKEILQKLS
ncbi:MAG: DUF815 domain-containing protein [Clostridia bacterium]|nr:DUF815 domain-containing protein [Clostridia bacterium]